MNKMTCLALLALLTAAPAAFAQGTPQNYGDYLGTSVDFFDVTETTQSLGDPDVLWDAPALAGTGDQLVFFPPNFTSLCAAGSSDTTSSLLTTTIEAHPSGIIENIALVESGDVTLVIAPPFGDPTTNATASLSGTLTVTETTSGPIPPVVIPFNGTFAPKATFELPGDFGTNNWSGSLEIDVASVQANATKADLVLDNTLDTNCGAGNSSGKIQKKVVSGPSVAIIVNPIECSLQLEKTCCVTQPALPDLDICEGEVVRMRMEYTGDSCRASNNDQGRAFRCFGRRRVGEPADITILKHADVISATPDSGIQIGDVVEFTSSEGTLEPRTKFKVTGPHWRRQFLRIDTSCERALRCGDQFGAFKLVELESTLGGTVDCSAPPPEPECASSGDPVGTPCDAKLVDMVLEYNGRDCQDPLPNPQNGEASCSGDATGAQDVGIIYTGMFPHKTMISPASGINDGDRIRVTSRICGGLFPNQKYLITDASGVRQSIDFHVSCSQPLALGDEFGSFKLVEFTTKNGTTVALGSGGDGTYETCEVPLVPPGPHCTSDLTELTLVYIGDYLGAGCTVSNPQDGYATCSGVADPGDPVSVLAGSGLVADPVELIEFGDLVALTADDDGDLPWLTTLDTTGAEGTQSIQIKTSCHKPLSLGDRFGAWVVYGMDREHEGPITLGGNIQYQYKVTNPNDSTVENVLLTDSELGDIASGLSIPAGEMETFVKTATLFSTTTNVATVSGDISGDVCEPGTDEVTVDVLLPPLGSFACSTPITQLTMIWNGTEIVDVMAWAGEPAASTFLGNFDDVAPGEALKVSGLEGTTPVWEIYDSTGAVKLGESRFDVGCGDPAMNGIEDCGKNLGNLKEDEPTLIDDWLFEGVVDGDETLDCTPDLAIPPGNSCGLGAELVLLLPGFLALAYYRRRRAA